MLLQKVGTRNRVLIQFFKLETKNTGNSGSVDDGYGTLHPSYSRMG